MQMVRDNQGNFRNVTPVWTNVYSCGFLLTFKECLMENKASVCPLTLDLLGTLGGHLSLVTTKQDSEVRDQSNSMRSSSQ